MSTLFVQPLQSPSSGGNNYSAARFYLYETGTTTAAVTYQDFDREVPHEHPIVADANGVFPVIWLDPTLSYRVQLKTSADALIYDVDPYAGALINEQAIIDLLSAGALGEILYPQTDVEEDEEITPSDFNYEDTPERYGYDDNETLAVNTVAMQSWALAASPRKRLRNKTYLCNDRLTFAQHCIVEGCGSGQSVIDFTDATGAFDGNRCVDFSQGSHSAIAALDGSLTAGDTQIDFLTAHNLAVGDVIQLLDDSVGSWSGHLDTFTKGEYCVVAEIVDANTIGLSSPLIDSYTDSSTDVFEFNYGTVNLSGFSVIGVGQSSAVIPLFLSHVARSRINDVKASGSGLTAATIRHAFDVQVDMVANQFYEGSEVGTQQYGLSLIHVQDVRVDGEYQGERHAVVTGSTTDGGVVNRHVRVSGTLRSLIDCAGDFHGNTEYSCFDGFVAHGGIALGGDRNAARNGVAIGHEDIHEGQPIRFREMLGFTFDLSNLYLRTLADPHSVGGTGVIDICGQDSTCLTDDTTRAGVLSINNVQVSAPNANAGVVFFNRGCTQTMDIRVRGLDLQLDSTVAASFGLFRLSAISGSDFNSFDSHGLTGNSGFRRSVINFDVTSVIHEDETLTAFTPGISFGGAAVGVTYTHQVGRYELDGNTVKWWVDILLSAKGSSAGQARITGLPFAVQSVSNFSPPALVQGVTVTFADALQGVHEGGASTVALQECTNGGVLTTITEGDFSNTSRIRASGMYPRAL